MLSYHRITRICRVANVFFVQAPHYVQLAECQVFNSAFHRSNGTCEYGYEISYYMPWYKFISVPACRRDINNIKGSLSNGKESIPEGLRAEIRQIQMSEP